MSGFNLIKDGLAVQNLIVEANKKVIPFPTPELARELHAQGKVIVHKPAELQRFVERSDDDTSPDDAA